MSKAILVTGGAGFIGANFVPYFCAKYPEYQVINLDKLTYAGNLQNLSECENMPNYTFVKGDICDEKLVSELFAKYDIRGVIHFAAESHVDNSIKGPKAFIETNIGGTFNLLENARRYWMEAPGKFKPGYEECRFHHISTDEVYGTLGETGLFREDTPYAPNSPYSASKASSDFIVRAYHHTYGLPTITVNTTNNYGPFQFPEKLIPVVILNALEQKSIPIYGDGQQIRDWLFVEDHVEALLQVLTKGIIGENYCIGAENEWTNLTIVRKICEILDKTKPLDKGSYQDLITFVSDRPGHDRRYAINAEKIRKTIGWSPKHSIETGLLDTVTWYVYHSKKLNSLFDRQRLGLHK